MEFRIDHQITPNGFNYSKACVYCVRIDNLDGIIMLDFNAIQETMPCCYLDKDYIRIKSVRTSI